MLVTLLAATFIVSVAVSTVVVLIFARPVDKILGRIISDQISIAWSKYLKFAIYVICISCGVRIWDFEKYIAGSQSLSSEIAPLTAERWIFEVYRTVIETLQGTAWVLLVFFVFALVAYGIVRVFETRARTV
jgi:hypothetical protein